MPSKSSYNPWNPIHFSLHHTSQWLLSARRSPHSLASLLPQTRPMTSFLWGWEFTGVSDVVKPPGCTFPGTQRDQPHRGGASLTPSIMTQNAKGHTCPHTIQDPQPHTATHEAPPQPVTNEATEGALVLWQEHTSQCLPPPEPLFTHRCGRISVGRSVSRW